MSRTKDKNCPFCGEYSLRMKNKNDNSGDYNYTYWKVKCNYCGASGAWNDTPDKALELWNMRKQSENGGNND